MEVPPGYGKNLATHIVCKLKKVLYGLKESPRAWFGRFARVMFVGLQTKPRGSHIVHQTLFCRGPYLLLHPPQLFQA